MSYCVRWRRRWDSEQLALLLELGAAGVELAADLGDRVLDHPLAHVVVRRGPDRDVLQVILDELSGDRIEVLEMLHLVAEQHDPVRGLRVGGEDLERLTADPKRAPRERGVVARVLDRDELAQQLLAIDHLALVESLQVLVVDLGRAEAEDAGHAGHDDDVPPREQPRRGRVAQPVDLLVDCGVLLDVEVLGGDVGLGLVVVVVGDEVLDRVAREVRAELVAQLGRQRLVVGDDQRRLSGPPRSWPPSSSSCPCRWRQAASGSARPPRSPVPAPRSRLADRRLGGRRIELELGHWRDFLA